MNDTDISKSIEKLSQIKPPKETAENYIRMYTEPLNKEITELRRLLREAVSELGNFRRDDRGSLHDGVISIIEEANEFLGD